jgi:hypothetical protein
MKSDISFLPLANYEVDPILSLKNGGYASPLTE